MKTRITLSVAALAFGAVLMSAPTFAQQAPHYGKGVDDGGLVDAPTAPAPKRLYNSVTAPSIPSTPHYGKGVDDGGLVDPPSAVQMRSTKSIEAEVAKQKPARPHYGKGVDDGGLVD